MPLAVVRRDNLVHVQAQGKINNEIQRHHPERRIEGVVLEKNLTRRMIYSNTRTFILREAGRPLHQGNLGQERGEQLRSVRDLVTIDHFIDEHAAEVNDCRDNAGVLRSREQRLQEDDLAKDGLTIQPEE